MKNRFEKVTNEEYKKQLLQILARIHNVCTENNIRYTIAFGTLLGAIRHRGFIPWDDDIDICMPREDYEIFKKAFSSSDGRYYVLDTKNSQYYFNNMSRACDGNIIMKSIGTEKILDFGAFVDVFILDRWPDDPEEGKKYREELIASMRRVKFALPWKIWQTAPAKRKIKQILHIKDRIYNRFIIGLKKRKEEKDELIIRYNNTITGWRNFASSSKKDITWLIREEDLDKRILVKFEDLNVYAPENYHELLSRRFGDYMKLPPEEQRKPHHHYIPYWKMNN